MAAAVDLESIVEKRVGSNPISPTIVNVGRATSTGLY